MQEKSPTRPQWAQEFNGTTDESKPEPEILMDPTVRSIVIDKPIKYEMLLAFCWAPR